MKTAIITAQGLGDGLLMMVAANHLKKNGHNVVIYNRYLSGFKKFFKNFKFKYPFTLDKTHYYDYILLEHDNSKLAYEIVNVLKDQKKTKLIAFMMNYSLEKHGLVNQSMFCFDQKKTVLENIAKATKIMFHLDSITFDNGISIPKGLRYRKNTNDIAIHPTASHIDKTWSKRKFVKLATFLRKKGFHPLFVVSTKERPMWLSVEKLGFKLPKLNDLDHLARVLYESYAFIGNDSGPAHLASNLKIPVIVIGKRIKNLKIWQPSWHLSKIIGPSKYVPNLKFFRLREDKWRFWIRIKKISTQLDQLLKK